MRIFAEIPLCHEWSEGSATKRSSDSPSCRSRWQLPGPHPPRRNCQFNRDIRFILSDNCFLCHGPDKNRRQADMRLDIRDEAMDHQAIVPGKPEESRSRGSHLQYRRGCGHAAAGVEQELSDEQKAIIKRWIAEGGEYQGHWAYEPRSNLRRRPESMPSTIWWPAAGGIRLQICRSRPSHARPATVLRSDRPCHPKPEQVEAFIATRRPKLTSSW